MLTIVWHAKQSGQKKLHKNLQNHTSTKLHSTFFDSNDHRLSAAIAENLNYGTGNLFHRRQPFAQTVFGYSDSSAVLAIHRFQLRTPNGIAALGRTALAILSRLTELQGLLKLESEL